ncbi:hypothetical protein TXYLGN1_17390 [Tepidimicrobium xylanilyticum]|nr:hypothetical protein EN5CB1_09590 [Tepidimicrobium xylanilyticum]
MILTHKIFPPYAHAKLMLPKTVNFNHSINKKLTFTNVDGLNLTNP